MRYIFCLDLALYQHVISSQVVASVRWGCLYRHQNKCVQKWWQMQTCFYITGNKFSAYRVETGIHRLGLNMLSQDIGEVGSRYMPWYLPAANSQIGILYMLVCVRCRTPYAGTIFNLYSILIKATIYYLWTIAQDIFEYQMNPVIYFIKGFVSSYFSVHYICAAGILELQIGFRWQSYVASSEYGLK